MSEVKGVVSEATQYVTIRATADWQEVSFISQHLPHQRPKHDRSQANAMRSKQSVLFSEALLDAISGKNQE